MTGRITIGIDGGGSGCRVALLQGDGAVVKASGGPANAFTDTAEAAAEITRTVMAALAIAKLPDTALQDARICAGIAGCRLPGLAADLAAQLPFAARVVDDSVIALRGALGADDGTLAMLGTGSFFLRQTGSAHRHIGGWGFTLGDEGSGAWLGRRAVAQALEVADGRAPPDALADALLERLAPHPLIALRGAGPVDYAALAPLVLDHARSPMGQRLIADSMAEVLRALTDLGHQPGEALVLSGGFGDALAPYLPKVLQVRLARPLGSPLEGALALAGELA